MLRLPHTLITIDVSELTKEKQTWIRSVKSFPIKANHFAHVKMVMRFFPPHRCICQRAIELVLSSKPEWMSLRVFFLLLLSCCFLSRLASRVIGATYAVDCKRTGVFRVLRCFHIKGVESEIVLDALFTTDARAVENSNKWR